ncbi:MAG: hypothetical protein ACLRXC_10580 [[Clostridium] leptum]
MERLRQGWMPGEKKSATVPAVVLAKRSGSRWSVLYFIPQAAFEALHAFSFRSQMRKLHGWLM